jgi:FlaA1/EpsC-like NDP-sugar epimerase
MRLERMISTSSLIRFLRRRLLVRRVLVLLAHVLLYAAAYLMAFLLRFDFKFPVEYGTQIPVGLLLVVSFRTVAGFTFHLYGGVLKYAGMRDLIDIFKAMTLATFAFVVAIVLFRQEFPRSIIAIDWFASIMLIGGLRFGMRTLREVFADATEDIDATRRRVAIVGAGDAGEALVRDLLRTYRDRYEVVGFFDDNPGKQGLRIHDVPVLAPVLYMGDFVPRHRIDEVIIAIPTATGETMRRIVSACKIAGVRFKTIPGVDQLIDGVISVSQIRDVAIEDLLGREPVHLEEGLIREFVHNKVIMVTGAGGSIGAELCRQIARYQPSRLLLLDQSEPNLFFIHWELTSTHRDLKTVPVIADVTDRTRIERIFSKHRPEVIFHAAAHKHVPMMEWNPGEAIKNNVFGTKTVADLANEFGAHSFVFISTDKAVNPTSVMGASKRVAEMYVQSLCRKSSTKFTAVRFGNVLGSVGSVVPIFKEQIAKGGPVTVTHPDMQRYFMTIPESCQLVMQAAAMGRGGEIFVLDMGEPVKILDLARDLITLSGFEPDRDIRIVFSGLRPGEKLFEELGFDAEKMNKTRHPKIYSGKLTPYPIEQVEDYLGKLQAVMNEDESGTLRATFKHVVPEFRESLDVEEPSVSLPPSEPPREVRRKKEGPAPLPRSESAVLPAAVASPPAPQREDPSPSTKPGPACGPSPAMETPEKESASAAPSADESSPESLPQNPAFDPAWKLFSELCREKGFWGAGWKTMGVKQPDRRHATFQKDGDTHRFVLSRSVSISALAFVELRFVYPGSKSKKIEPVVKEAIREISARMSLELAALHRQLT